MGELGVRVACLFIAGLFLGGQINRAIYRLAWNPRPIGPWSNPHPDAPARRFTDRLPVWGWFGMEREAALHGRWFWIRPMLIELTTAVGLPALYVWEIGGGLAPGQPLGQAQLHAQFFSHVLLLSCMMIATFVDIDEKTIPDDVTIPGTLAALIVAALLPCSLLPVPGGVLLLSTPFHWPAWLSTLRGLALGLLAYAAWCLAIAPQTVWFRSGWWRGIAYLITSIRRHAMTKWIGLMLIVGCLAIVAAWWRGGPHWQALLSTLCGMAFGGGLVWAVRLVAGWTLGKEAMGFGDVILMAMIGAFLGWQSTLFVFFLAPFAGVAVAVGQWIVTRKPEIAFGPFLCIAALATLLIWPDLWARWGPVFHLGWWLIAILVCSLILLGLMLAAWRRFTRAA
jgi:prepilin signal peptidase PulO-like enzyme (type II secretory pathway)